MVSCSENKQETGNAVRKLDIPEYAQGADISWATEMTKSGKKFYDADGNQMECTALMKSLGFNSVRFRVWVNPSDGYCGKIDLLDKCRKASALGMNIMIDFHYSDTWADPGSQTVPSAWSTLDVAGITSAVTHHTKEILNAIRSAGIDVSWVQIGNEVNNGMLWETGRVQGKDAANFASYFNAGAKAAKQVYPDAKVILHSANGWDITTLKWFFSLAGSAGVQYDMIGLSLYPSYWDDVTKDYIGWQEKCEQFVSNISTLNKTYAKPVMLCEFGMPVARPEMSREALQYILDNTKGADFFKGIFMWEPESESTWKNYAYGAFKDGKATVALEPFMQK